LDLSSRVLDDFKGVGQLAGWPLVSASVAGFAAYLGWSGGITTVFVIAFAYSLAYAILWLCRARGTAPSDRPAALATGFGASALGAFVAAAAVTAALHTSARQGESRFPERLAFALAFTCAAILPRIYARASDEVRRIADEERHARELEQQSHQRQLAEMRLKALQAQVEPHFLFNTLANVQHLLRTSPPDADLMLESLISYLKSALPQLRSGTSTVGEELARVAAYLAIMRVRMADRLRYQIDVPAVVFSLPLPPLSLITLVENAVEHGLEPRPGGGTIRIDGGIEGGLLRLRVTDDGLGFKSEIGSGIGLTNLRERLMAIHGDGASLELLINEPGGVKAALTIPVTAPAAND
jgi:hypothetical protein